MSLIYLQETVYDAALARIRRLYEEFPEIVVDFSGGKDSTVILHLTLAVAQEYGRLPLKVLFIDQEAEWEMVITYIRQVMARPDVQPLWFQGPFFLFNASSQAEPWLPCWQPGGPWLRAKEPASLHDNCTGVDRFHALFDALVRTYVPQRPCAHIAGVRCQESPARMKGLTNSATYKDITWGTNRSAHHGIYTFYPLYDWRWQDVWKAIHTEGWPYCALYDAMYQHGRPMHSMRVSNVHHETALASLTFMQEIEPHMWDAVTRRLAGVNAVKQSRELYAVPKTLPRMFASWTEYRDYLVTHLITDPQLQARFAQQFAQQERAYSAEVLPALVKSQIAALLVNDYHGTKFGSFASSHVRHSLSWQAKHPTGVFHDSA